jgi:hypothetical protein
MPGQRGFKGEGAADDVAGLQIENRIPRAKFLF